MKSIIFIAPPAAGKGTQSELVSAKYHIPHISTGQLLREESRKPSERGRYIRKQMEAGGLVSDEVTLELLEERLSHSDCNNGYILDGFPRDVGQAKAYDNLLSRMQKELGFVIILDLSKESAMDRVVGRLTCSNCGAVYNSRYEKMRPKVEGICNSCYGILSQREDDTASTFEKRFETYLNMTESLIQYYEDKGVAHHVSSADPKEVVFSNIEKILGENDEFN